MNDCLFCKIIAGQTGKVIEKKPDKRKLPKDLTARELEICGLLTKGYSNSELAKELFLAEGTVKNYMMSLYDKFDIHDRTALVLFLKEMISE